MRLVKTAGSAGIICVGIPTVLSECKGKPFNGIIRYNF